MKIRTCMGRYQAHILALKPDNKSSEMPRITFNEYKFDITVENDQLEKVYIVLLFLNLISRHFLNYFQSKKHFF